MSVILAEMKSSEWHATTNYVLQLWLTRLFQQFL